MASVNDTLKVGEITVKLEMGFSSDFFGFKQEDIRFSDDGVLAFFRS